MRRRKLRQVHIEVELTKANKECSWGISPRPKRGYMNQAQNWPNARKRDTFFPVLNKFQSTSSCTEQYSIGKIYDIP